MQKVDYLKRKKRLQDKTMDPNSSNHKISCNGPPYHQNQQEKGSTSEDRIKNQEEVIGSGVEADFIYNKIQI